MLGIGIWNLLGIMAIICLVAAGFSIGRKQIWGGVVIGVIAGIVVFLINLIMGNGFDFILLKNTVIVCVLLGGAFAILNETAAPPKKSKKRKKLTT